MLHSLVQFVHSEIMRWCCLLCSVQVPQYNMEPYKEVSVNSGKDITLMCDIEGTPVPRVIWQVGTRIVANFPRKLFNYTYSTQ